MPLACIRPDVLPGHRLAAASSSYCFTGRSWRLQAGCHRWTGNILLTTLLIATARFSCCVALCKQLNPNMALTRVGSSGP